MDREKAKWYDPSYTFVEFAYEKHKMNLYNKFLNLLLHIKLKQFIEKKNLTKINLNH